MRPDSYVFDRNEGQLSDRAARVLTGSDPVFHTRVRIAHKQTASRGWEYDTTVEVAFDATESELDEVADVARAHMQSELRRAAQDGKREVETRNRADAG